MVREVLHKQNHTSNVDRFLDEKIAELVDLIRANREQIEQFEAAIDAAKDDLRELLEARGSGWSDDEGYARVAAEGVRRYYDSNALDQLIINEPLRYGWLGDYRKEAAIPSRIQVK